MTRLQVKMIIEEALSCDGVLFYSFGNTHTTASSIEEIAEFVLHNLELNDVVKIEEE